MNYSIEVGESIRLVDTVSVSVLRSPSAVGELMTFLIVATIIFIFQYFIFKFIENVHINLSEFPKKKFWSSLNWKSLVSGAFVLFFTSFLIAIKSFINKSLQFILGHPGININLNIGHIFMIIFLTLWFLVPRFIVKIIEDHKKNGKYYFVLLLICLFFMIIILRISMNSYSINLLKLITDQFGVNYG